ncbi:MAG: glycoside hydrolase family 15 protein [Acidimicrobiales bacterium]
MGSLIEDYAVIGDLHTAAIVGRDGSIDWLCLPHFDSGSCFARLIGTDEHGFWRVAPAGPEGTVTATRRRYREGTLVLETEFDTATGSIRLTDCMPVREQHPQVVRLVECLRGKVPVRMELCLRFGYGESIPWVSHHDGMLTAIAGPDAVALWTRAETRGAKMRTIAEVTMTEGQQLPFTLSWYPSHEPAPRPFDPWYTIATTDSWWRAWSADCTYDGDYGDAVLRSLITLKALSYEPTGGIVAAATTSLPEALGGNRNWDYRYCWLRDATLTLEALMRGGYHNEAMAWRDWLLRATAGDPSRLQIMYGSAGERRLDEWEVSWLPGYESSAPVRIGNAAAGQYQLDVYGEVMSALFSAAQNAGVHSRAIWDLQTRLIEFIEKGWTQPDDGIWEVRGPRRHFTHSKVMAWVAVDRAVRTLEEWPQLDGPIDKWRKLRDEIHAEVCDKGYNKDKQAFTQYYGSDTLDASVLMMPLVDFLPPSDPRVVSTVEAIQRELVEDGFVLRYRTSDDGAVDGLTGREGAFLACSFWLVDCLHMIGRVDEARAMFERLLALRNDLGLLSEEYDPVAKRLVGNFPQAFSHVSLVNTACRLTDQEPLSPGNAVAANRFRSLISDNLVGSINAMNKTGRPKIGAGLLLSRLNGHRWHDDPVVAPGPGGAPDDGAAGGGAQTGPASPPADADPATAPHQ